MPRGLRFMGLDVSHDCWHGAYSAFMRWRQEIARAAGIPLTLMENFYDAPDPGLVERTRPRTSAFTVAATGGFVADRGSLTAALADAAERGDGGRWERWVSTFSYCLPLKWESFRPDSLHKLLNHSDCDGCIAADDCAPLANRLEELLPLLPAEPDAGHIGDWKQKTQKFIDGLRLAASQGEDVEFY